MGKKWFIYLLPAFALLLVITAASGQHRLALATTGDWMPNRSGMYGGTVKTLAFSPTYKTDTTVFAGTYLGGIFRSLDGGEHWQEVNEGLGGWDVIELAVSPNFADDHTLFAGTSGGHLHKSTNSGETWAVAAQGLNDHTTLALAISPGYNKTDQTVFAGSDSNGVFRSTDGGTNWSKVNTGLPSQKIMDLAITSNYTNTPILFAATASDGVFRSDNGGDSWIAVNTGLTLTVIALAVSPNFASDQVLFAATSHTGVFKSDNGGNSWVPVNSGLSALDMKMIELAIAPNYGKDGVQTLYAALDHNGVVKSTNGGASWQAVGATDIDNIQMAALAISPAFATDQTLLAGMGSGRGLYKSTDGGNNWNHTVTGITAAPVTDLIVSPNLVNDNLMFAASYGSGVFRSEDRGGSWKAVNKNLTASIIHVLGISPAFASDRTLFAGTFDGMFRTTDRGDSWQFVEISVDIPEVDVRAIAFSPNFATDHILFAGTDGGLFKSENAGDAWSLIDGGLPMTDRGFPMSVISLGISPNFSQDHVIFAGTDEKGVYRSKDSGASWHPVNMGMGEGQISVLAVSPTYTLDQMLYAAKYSNGTHELYRSTDGGDSWSLVNIPNGWVENMAFSPNYANDGKIYAGTHYSGVYYYDRSDNSWTRLDPETDVDNVQSLAVIQTDVTAVFVGSQGSGVWVHTDNDVPIATPPTTPGPPDCPAAVWNALIYLNGDNDLEHWTADLFNELEQAASNPCVRILALWDRAGIGDTTLYWVQADDRPFDLAPYTTNINKWERGEQDMGNPQTLVNFVTQAHQNFPAAHTFLSLVDHGNGWSPSIPPGPKKYTHAGMSFDDSSGGSYLSTESLADALGAITGGGSNKLDVLFFDACLMGMVENLYPLRNFVRFVIASQNETFSSYPYAKYLNEINSSTTAGALAAHIVEQYDNSLDGYPRTMAAYNLAQMSVTANAVTSFANELRRIASASISQREQINVSFGAVQKFDSNVDLRLTISDTYVDLHHFAQLVMENVDDKDVDNSAQALMTALGGSGQPLVLLNHKAKGVYWRNGEEWNLDNAYGLSIYLPLRTDDFFLRYYGDRELTFARDTAWDEFIRVMVPAVQAPSVPPAVVDERSGPLGLLPTPTATATPTPTITVTPTPDGVKGKAYLPLVDQ